MVGIRFCFVLLLLSPSVQYDVTVITVLSSIKYVSRVNFDSTYRKIKVENTILRFLPLKYSATWTENRKIGSYQKFQSSRTAKICSRKPQKIANPQNKTPQNFHATRYSSFQGMGYKRSAQRLLGSFGWTSVIYDRLMAALNTIDQPWLTHVHPNDPRNHYAQSLYPFSLEVMKWGIGKTFLKESIWRINIYFVDGQVNFTTTITTERINARLVLHNWITRDKRPWQRLLSKERNFRSYLVRSCLGSALK